MQVDIRCPSCGNCIFEYHDAFEKLECLECGHTIYLTKVLNGKIKCPECGCKIEIAEEKTGFDCVVCPNCSALFLAEF